MLKKRQQSIMTSRRRLRILSLFCQTSDIEKDQNLGHMLNFKLAQSSTKKTKNCIKWWQIKIFKMLAILFSIFVVLWANNLTDFECTVSQENN